MKTDFAHKKYETNATIGDNMEILMVTQDFIKKQIVKSRIESSFIKSGGISQESCVSPEKSYYTTEKFIPYFDVSQLEKYNPKILSQKDITDLIINKEVHIWTYTGRVLHKTPVMSYGAYAKAGEVSYYLESYCFWDSYKYSEIKNLLWDLPDLAQQQLFEFFIPKTIETKDGQKTTIDKLSHFRQKYKIPLWKNYEEVKKMLIDHAYILTPEEIKKHKYLCRISGGGPGSNRIQHDYKKISEDNKIGVIKSENISVYFTVRIEVGAQGYKTYATTKRIPGSRYYFNPIIVK